MDGAYRDRLRAQWNPDIAKAQLIGPTAVGKTAGMEIPSTIGEVMPLKKIAWSGETGGILGTQRLQSDA
jgi:hypothetical protein